MSSYREDLASRRARRMKPTTDTYRALGAELMAKVPAKGALDQIGAAHGLTRAQAWHACALAAGKLVYRLRERIAQATNPCADVLKDEVRA